MKPDAFDHALDDIQVRLERLFALYEQFLAGDERIDPMGLQKDIGRRIVRLQGEANAKGAAGARLAAIVDRYENLQRYWERLSGRMKSGAHQRPLSAERVEPHAVTRSASSGGWDASKIDGPIQDSTLRGYSVERPLVARPLVTPLPRDPSKRNTPPLGTPIVHEPWGEPTILPTSLGPSPLSDSTKTTQHMSVRDLEARLRESAITQQDLQATPADEPLSQAETRRENEPPRAKGGMTLAMPVSSTDRVPASSERRRVRAPFEPPEFELDRATTSHTERRMLEDEAETVPRFKLQDPEALLAIERIESERAKGRSSAVTPERVQEIQSLLLVMNPGSPRVSLPRLTKMLEDCEAKLRAEHGERVITFDVVVKDGKGVIKPIVR